LLSDLGQDIQQITSGSGKAIQPRDDHRVALRNGVQKLPELRAVSPSTTDLFPKNFGAPGRFQVSKLRIQGLSIRANPGVPEDGHRSFLSHI
jgi:hypothetical protein